MSRSSASHSRRMACACAVESLKRHRAAQNAERLRLGGIWEDRGLVFPNRTGGFLSPYLLTDGPLKRPLERAGLPPIRFHDLRHTCATILLSRGVHAKLVQELLGHATISITLDTYSHVLPGMDDGLADAMGDALS
jgi:integrase